jgi:hypothetical protein
MVLAEGVVVGRRAKMGSRQFSPVQAKLIRTGEVDHRRVRIRGMTGPIFIFPELGISSALSITQMPKMILIVPDHSRVGKNIIVNPFDITRQWG